MKGERVNRRLVVIAFIVAVLLGAGGQAVALWSQSGNVTMGVTYGKLPPVTFEPCGNRGGSSQIALDWDVNKSLNDYLLTVSKTSNNVTTVVSEVRQAANRYVIQTPSDAKTGDVLTLRVIGHSGGYQTEVKAYGPIDVGPPNGSGNNSGKNELPLLCNRAT
ncbi:hypothetical protein GC088_04810 [Arthrobacter sp. JZ12]|uniref:hypothetical protein n=1 Tax=Arthrobacter sp. JZ12 TaxID=2654190 RepID=UPI002B475783|nr:hypothetical protein [Arthrobacter sp. JZ12]WRH24471.1 hypothetical protein GC088_04810 [Arthrobacter sp. JZ12]